MVTEAEVRQAVTTAFDAVSGLTKDAVLHKSQSSGFDFSTGNLVTSTSNLPVKVLIYTIEKPSEKTTPAVSEPLKRALLKDTGLNLTLYDELQVGTTTYRIEAYEYYTGLYVLELR